MDSHCVQSQIIPLQGATWEQPKQPGEMRVLMPPVTTAPVQDHIVWSLCTFIYTNICCIGLVAFIYSIKARDSKVIGDMVAARQYGSTACRLNCCALILILTITAVTIFIITVFTVQVLQALYSMSSTLSWNKKGFSFP